MKIDRETFQATSEKEEFSYGTSQHGTIQVEFANRELTVDCVKWENGDIFLKGFVGRYRTSSKAWNASVIFRGEKAEHPLVDFGRDDRSGKFQKENMISYEPTPCGLS